MLTSSSALLVGLGLLGPLVCSTLGRFLARAFERASLLSPRLAATAVAYRPTEPMAVVVAIVMALGSTIADASLIASVRTSWLRWMDDYVRCDLIVTAGSRHSRNWRFDRILAEGKSIDEALREVGMTVEGYVTAVSARELAAKHGIEMPITSAVHKLCYEGKAPADALEELLGRDPKPEHY